MADAAGWPGRFASRDSGKAADDPRRGRVVLVLAFLAPALLLYAAFTIYPVLRTFYNAFHAIKPQGVVEFVGLRNFTALLVADPVFWKAVANTALFTIVATLIDVVGGLLLALCLFARAPLAPLLRVVWFTPVLMSYVVVGIIWVWIFDYDWGLANAVLRWLGLGAFEQSWLGQPSTALWSVLTAHEWKWLGFNMIVFLAALHALPGEVLGAAELDNCGWFAKTVYIIVPMLRTTIVNLLVLSFIGKMMVFDLIWVMTGGGPLWSTETVSTYVYKRAFEWNTFDLGYPSAIAVLWFIIILAFVAIMTRVLRQRDRLEF
jgi:ABC-type sugar transport system permease subunit